MRPDLLLLLVLVVVVLLLLLGLVLAVLLLPLLQVLVHALHLLKQLALALLRKIGCGRTILIRMWCRGGWVVKSGAEQSWRHRFQADHHDERVLSTTTTTGTTIVPSCHAMRQDVHYLIPPLACTQIGECCSAVFAQSYSNLWRSSCAFTQKHKSQPITPPHRTAPSRTQPSLSLEITDVLVVGAREHHPDHRSSSAAALKPTPSK